MDSYFYWQWCTWHWNDDVVGRAATAATAVIVHLLDALAPGGGEAETREGAHWLGKGDKGACGATSWWHGGCVAVDSVFFTSVIPA